MVDTPTFIIACLFTLAFGSVMFWGIHEEDKIEKANAAHRFLEYNPKYQYKNYTMYGHYTNGEFFCIVVREPYKEMRWNLSNKSYNGLLKDFRDMVDKQQ
jgi:hypothetical protein